MADIAGEPTWRAPGLVVPCPFCGAAAGERCVTLTTGQRTQFNHGIRNDVASGGGIPTLYAVDPSKPPCGVCGEPWRHYAGTVIALHKPGCRVAAGPRSRSGSNNRMRQEQVTVRLTGDELERLTAMAEEKHLTVASLLREAGLALEQATLNGVRRAAAQTPRQPSPPQPAPQA